MRNTLHTKNPLRFSMCDSRYNLPQLGKEKVKLFNREKLPQSPRFSHPTPALNLCSTHRTESQFIAHRGVGNAADDGLTQDSIRRGFRIRPAKSPAAFLAPEGLFFQTTRRRHPAERALRTTFSAMNAFALRKTAPSRSSPPIARCGSR